MPSIDRHYHELLVRDRNEEESAMNTDLQSEEQCRLLQLIASTVVTLGERVESLYESAATKNEMQNQSAATRGDIQQVQQRLNVIESALTR